MNVPLNVHQPALRWLAALRRCALWQRVALAFVITALGVLARAIWLPRDLEAGRDLLLLLVALLSLLLGLVPGLVAGVTARALSIWWFVAPGVPGAIRPWDHLGVAAILLVTIVAASLAGNAILLMGERDDPSDHPPR
jgi:hypothetical protein